MKNTVSESEALNNYFKEREYTANSYVMRCFSISMFIYLVCFLLNLFEIFIIDKEIMLMGFVPAVVIYLIMLIITKSVSLSSRKIKYFCCFVLFRCLRL